MRRSLTVQGSNPELIPKLSLGLLMPSNDLKVKLREGVFKSELKKEEQAVLKDYNLVVTDRVELWNEFIKDHDNLANELIDRHLGKIVCEPERDMILAGGGTRQDVYPFSAPDESAVATSNIGDGLKACLKVKELVELRNEFLAMVVAIRERLGDRWLLDRHSNWTPLDENWTSKVNSKGRYLFRREHFGLYTLEGLVKFMFNVEDGNINKIVEGVVASYCGDKKNFLQEDYKNVVHLLCLLAAVSQKYFGSDYSMNFNRLANAAHMEVLGDTYRDLWLRNCLEDLMNNHPTELMIGLPSLPKIDQAVPRIYSSKTAHDYVTRMKKAEAHDYVTRMNEAEEHSTIQLVEMADHLIEKPFLSQMLADEPIVDDATKKQEINELKELTSYLAPERVTADSISCNQSLKVTICETAYNYIVKDSKSIGFEVVKFFFDNYNPHLNDVDFLRKQDRDTYNAEAERLTDEVIEHILTTKNLCDDERRTVMRKQLRSALKPEEPDSPNRLFMLMEKLFIERVGILPNFSLKTPSKFGLDAKAQRHRMVAAVTARRMIGILTDAQIDRLKSLDLGKRTDPRIIFAFTLQHGCGLAKLLEKTNDPTIAFHPIYSIVWAKICMSEPENLALSTVPLLADNAEEQEKLVRTGLLCSISAHINLNVSDPYCPLQRLCTIPVSFISKYSSEVTPSTGKSDRMVALEMLTHIAKHLYSYRSRNAGHRTMIEWDEIGETEETEETEETVNLEMKYGQEARKRTIIDAFKPLNEAWIW
eukprot:GHVH01001078.1.p1 GENE.GHVH01001078.1~~GHVH01001078.1.p1  ORF type:complete len:762 (+),score=92.39 GHVH01001078.1:116-2401(+)